MEGSAGIEGVDHFVCCDLLILPDHCFQRGEFLVNCVLVLSEFDGLHCQLLGQVFNGPLVLLDLFHVVLDQVRLVFYLTWGY